MLNPIAYPVLAAFALAANSIALRKLMKGENDAWALTAMGETFGVAISLFLLLSLGMGFFAPANFDLASVPQSAWIAMAVSSVLFGLAIYPGYKSYHYLEAGEVRLLHQLINPLNIAIGFVVFGERLVPLQFFAVILLLAGIVIATYTGKKIALKVIGLQLVLATVALYAAAAAFDKYSAAYIPPLIYSVPMFFVPAVFAYAACGMRKGGIREALRLGRENPLGFFAVAATNVAAYTFLLIAFQLMPLSVATPIIGTSVIMTVLGGWLLLGENDNLPRKIAGALLAAIGLAMLG